MWTSVDLYKTSADANRGLASWKRDDRRITVYSHHRRLAVALKRERVAPVGGGRFAVLVSYRAANIAPLFGFDEQFTEGRYEADVTVWAGSEAVAKRLAPRLARKLEARINRALAGRLHAKPVKLPVDPKAGPPRGGPDISTLALKPTDLPGRTGSRFRGYVGLYPLALSFYRCS